MFPPRIHDPTSPLCGEIIRSASFLLESQILRNECVSRVVACGTGGCIGKGYDVRLDDGVLETVNHGVHTEAEHMLVVVRVDVGSDGGTVRVWLVVAGHVHLQNPSQANLEFDVAALVEVVRYANLIVALTLNCRRRTVCPRPPVR
jgi:hypothetical protein